VWFRATAHLVNVKNPVHLAYSTVKHTIIASRQQAIVVDQ
jgi:hypothetical protein